MVSSLGRIEFRVEVFRVQGLGFKVKFTDCTMTLVIPAFCLAAVLQ